MKIYAKNQEFKELLRHMKFVIQRVTHADVVVDGNEIGRIGKGFMVLIGVSKEDDKAIADKMVDKMIKLRIFEDENGKTNLSLDDVGGDFSLSPSLRSMLIVRRAIDHRSSTRCT